jgi:glycosyltransferase involved in cell wall biosynthesis
MPLVSVIIPAYNSGRYLDEAVQSVIAQTFTDWECIVVDDGSTEDLSRVGKMDSRVRLIRQPNRGTAAARNNGVASSTGEFVAFLDHDDLWLPGNLDAQTALLAANPRAGFCYAHYDMVDGDGKRQAVPPSDRPARSYLEMLRGGAPIPSTVVVGRLCLAVVGGFDPMLPYSDDQDVMLKLAYFFEVEFVPSCQVLYRIHSGNASRNYDLGHKTMMNLAEKHANAATVRNDAVASDAARRMKVCWRRFFGIRAYDAARGGLRERDFHAFAVHLRRAVAWNPRYVAAALAGFPLQKAMRKLR